MKKAQTNTVIVSIILMVLVSAAAIIFIMPRIQEAKEQVDDSSKVSSGSAETLSLMANLTSCTATCQKAKAAASQYGAEDFCANKLSLFQLFCERNCPEVLEANNKDPCTLSFKNGGSATFACSSGEGARALSCDIQS